jgi:hypothetical protein
VIPPGSASAKPSRTLGAVFLKIEDGLATTYMLGTGNHLNGLFKLLV